VKIPVSYALDKLHTELLIATQKIVEALNFLGSFSLHLLHCSGSLTVWTVKSLSAVPKIKTKAQEKVYVRSSESEMENRKQKVNDSH